jgi:Alcohol acetyltransferase
VTLEDQAVGLLRYIPSISKWTVTKIGQERDSSYNISNLGSFEAGAVQKSEGNQCNITKMIFSRPATPISPPLTVSIVSVKGGSMVMSMVWQPGSFGIPLESESAFVDGLSAFVKEDLKGLE